MHTIPSPTLEALESLELPTPPRVLLAFLQAVGRDNASIDEIAELVRREPSLTARILTVANSAAFHADGPLRSLKQSMQVLGLRTLHSIAACLAVREAFASVPGPRAGDLDGFWRHSIFVAELAQSIATETGRVDAEEAYLAGLLHDVGELLLLGGLGARYGALLTEAGAEQALVPLEQAALATDHAAVGAWLIDRWRLPSFMADAVLLHHHQLQDVAEADALTRVLWVAHTCVGLAASDAPDVADFEAIGQLVGLPSKLLARLYGQAQASVTALATALGVTNAGTGSSLPAWRPAPEPATARDVSRDGLRDTVSSMAALQPLQHELASADSEPVLLNAARESARLLFGVRDVVFLLRQGADASLAPLLLPGQPPQLQQLRLSLQPGTAGACGRAALANRICSTFETGPAGPLAVADMQLARALGAEGLLCVPMAAAGAVQGVMVCPVGRLQAERLEQRLALLGSFAGVLAGHLQSWRTLRERDRERQVVTADRLRLRERQVAHEVSNPLGIIKNYLQIVRRKLPDSLQLGEELTVLHEEIDRVARIVCQLGDLPAEPAVDAVAGLVSLNTVAESLRALYGEPLFGRRGIQLVLDLQTPLAPTRADHDHVRQMLLNLWKNAAEALPPGARVTTSTSDHIHRDGRVYTQLSVTDNGPGLPDEVMRELFKPLGAERRPGHGGLGLSIVQALATRLEGHVSCQSLPGRGASFFVLLPQAVAPVTDAKAAP
ncbi:MAG: HDOD domain-containing protein [Hydrogenophaga sp.]|uniref:HDOD domain-containing protein n=1 Tax=Hydrogenophaga sp. TaxID=1904254 RepID=UPI002726727C|nr:HDOD domain-containing protein [Hydrogenophaga sp.]MDO9032810.1 HDOD domain-containing protein [Hydrogenophaga sp.]